MFDDTIAAVSTAAGDAALSVIRVSGAKAFEIADGVLRPVGHSGVGGDRRAILVRAMDVEGQQMDQGIMLRFRGPASYTGEDTVEFQGHGGLLVTQRVLEALLRAGARSAEPGEFTQRAFLNGKMELSQAEAVMDLIHAQSNLALRAANEQLGGVIGRETERLRVALVGVLAHVEAYIDFPDEDIAPDTGAELLGRLEKILTDVHRLIDTADQGRILRHGARSVIAGEPNVGKSSLLNVLLGFERAIVSPKAGTTRDTIEEIIQVHGISLRLVDTAGLRDDGDEIERLGMDRTTREMERADLILEVVDGSLPPSGARRIDVPESLQGRCVLVLNKGDLGIHPGWSEERDAVAFSCVDGSGTETLRDAIRRVVLGGGGFTAEHPLAINARHQHCFEKAQAHLKAGMEELRAGAAPEWVALNLREALQAFGEVVGRTDIEEILDVVFSSFCIGK